MSDTLLMISLKKDLAPCVLRSRDCKRRGRLGKERIRQTRFQQTKDTCGSVASKALAWVSHSAEARMSASRMQPLLLLKAKTLHCDGWKSAAVMTWQIES